MATKSVALIASDWVLVSSAPAGFFENLSAEKAIYVAAVSKPASTVTKGHAVAISAGRGFWLNAGEQLYARTLLAAGELLVTE